MIFFMFHVIIYIYIHYYYTHWIRNNLYIHVRISAQHISAFEMLITVSKSSIFIVSIDNKMAIDSELTSP